MRHEIKTMSGVMNANDEPGQILVAVEKGSTMVDLTVVDGVGDSAKVFLDYHQVARLMMALGAATVDL